MKTETKRYAVVDLEATGTGPLAAIIQVGIVIIENDQIVTSYATDVNPHQELDDHIVQLTGITDAQLAEAPPFSQVAKPIYDLLEGAVFVAHNVQFDANLLAEHLFMEGYDLRSDRIDTVELAQIAFPQLDRYNLSELSQQLDLDLSAAHTAIADATATAQLFLAIRDKLRSLPRETLATMCQLAGSLLYETGQVLAWAYEQALPADLQTYDRLGDLVLKKPQSPRAVHALDLSFEGAMAELDLLPRPAQTAFVAELQRLGQAHQVNFLEGPTGLGKTYAYLLGLLTQPREGQLVVAVPTKLLQDQLMSQEGQQLSARLGISLTSIKGASNYLDLAKFAASLKQVEGNRLIQRHKLQLLVWLLETATGDLDEVGQKQQMLAYFDRLRHEGEIDQASPYLSHDFWRRVKAASQTSQVLVTNHAFLLASCLDQPDYLANKTLVVDEAQSFFLTVEQSLWQRVNLTEFLVTTHQVLAGQLPLLQRRLLERIQTTLLPLVTLANQKKQLALPASSLALLGQDVSECQLPHVAGLSRLLLTGLSDFWLESRRQDQKRQVDLVGAGLERLAISRFIPPSTQAYFISATIAISKRVGLPDLLGFEDYGLSRLDQVIQDQQTIWIDEDMPAHEEGETSYLTALVDRLGQLAHLDVPTVVLFRAKHLLLATSDLLDQAGLDHLAQTKHGDAPAIKRRLDKQGRGLLLGLGAFWEGVDFSSQAQYLLVITKLPFDNPKEPVIKRLNTYLKAQGKHPFYDYALPVASLRLRQALGRVQRGDQQRSAVLILDQRLLSKAYGKSLIKGLAQLAPVRTEKFAQILLEMRDFCYNGTDKMTKEGD